MKKILFVLGFVLAGQFLMAQSKPTDVDKSPMDVSYLPANYPISKMRGQTTGEPLARVLYSRPQKKGREIFGGEVKYNEVWRLGANEATELELFKNATIGGKKIPKGRYSLYCIPLESKWTIVVNKDNYSWGSFTYKAEKDVARIDVPVQKTGDNVEALTMYFDNNSLIVQWENLKVAVPFAF
ncbi:DUF2911 domain-containing protein [Segetibacter sp.]|jgi:hypothetical protein|uniref:DUF2911 domain-containing protein n=1 Tax=Segetibacter sp. TaxID=2231182 RepID=UPI002613B12D|nr:DUF2911 domain-containing protein [Segetibacter sp.]MCW3081371.1 hypothetical protein [Segetibacter sp.]